MKFDISPHDAIPITQKWLEQNPQESWSSLRDLLMNNQLVISGRELVPVNRAITSNGEHSNNQSQYFKAVKKAVRISKRKKKRRYRGVEYE